MNNKTCIIGSQNSPSETNKIANETTYFLINKLSNDDGKNADQVQYAWVLLRCSTCATYQQHPKLDCLVDCYPVVHDNSIPAPTPLAYYCYWAVKQNIKDNKPPPNQYPLCLQWHFYWIMQQIVTPWNNMEVHGIN